MHSSSDKVRHKVFEIKGGLFPLTVLRLLRDDIEEIARRLGETLRQAPTFFSGAPLVIDLKAVESSGLSDFAGLITLLKRHGMVPIGVRHGTNSQRQQAREAGLAVLPDGSTQRLRSTPIDQAVDSGKTAPTPPLIVNRPVRSGQQLYAAGTDLVVLAPVNAGAEILADGSIHVYGALRGRALAGISGQTEARIFCQSLEAEVIAIAGIYRVLEEPDPRFRDQQVQVFLVNDSLLIEPV